MISNPTEIETMPARQGTIRLTVVTPVFNEADNLDRYAAEVTAVLLNAPGINARVLFVDDGSTDGSWPKLCSLIAAEPRFSAIRLSRNYGAHYALAAALDASGDALDAVAILACDMQDPPATVLDFVAAWREGADIVWGKRRTRSDAGWRAKAAGLLEATLRRHAMPRHSRFTTGSFLLMDARVLACLRQFREHSRVTFALVAWTGFDQSVVLYDRQARRAGASGWRFAQLLNTAYDVLIGFSPMPARLITAIGLGLSGLSLVAIVYLLAAWAFARVQPGWTGLMVTLTFCFGVLFMMLGLMAEYLHRIFIESKNRPLYFIAESAGSLGPPRD